MTERKSTKGQTTSTHKTKDRVARTKLKTGGELGCSGRVAVPPPLVTPIVLI
jgi:hypothetical protein